MGRAPELEFNEAMKTFVAQAGWFFQRQKDGSASRESDVKVFRSFFRVLSSFLSLDPFGAPLRRQDCSRAWATFGPGGWLRKFESDERDLTRRTKARCVFEV
ncbi:hypothetical protein KM043_005103 [Ampulex compressa]|nr:hypothetical protein KM043_005103 [Ampulex compressa]